MRREDDVSNFEDPELRSAIRRVWAKQSAPPELHRRLAELAATEPVRSGPAAPMRWLRHPLFSLAAAAIVLIAVGVVAMRFTEPAAPAPAASPLPGNLAAYLIHRHDACCKLPDHHDPHLPHDDLKAIAVVLKAKLGFPIMSGEPSAAPWKFDGASICPVGPVHGAHLIFKLPTQDISIFSLPLSVDPQAAGQGELTMIEDGHPIAAFATKHAFYAVVGSSTDNSLTLAAITAMCNHLRPLVVPAAGQQSVASIN
ncbi:MAG TPA: hypothetical protein VHY37_08745 [Tepidisphaeraceae bacterium]|nr:hypothetical protein [Tepidisphaeraceae bacterium]